jgi:hypothetical protein
MHSSFVPKFFGAADVENRVAGAWLYNFKEFFESFFSPVPEDEAIKAMNH